MAMYVIDCAVIATVLPDRRTASGCVPRGRGRGACSLIPPVVNPRIWIQKPRPDLYQKIQRMDRWNSETHPLRADAG